MFVIVYRWKVKERREAEFVEGWHRVTEELRRRCGSLGSRLHAATDGTWVAYAQWPDRRTWEAAQGDAEPDGSGLMRESIEQRYPEIHMDVVDDLLSGDAERDNGAGA
jgi:hypothetical protein